MWSRLHGAERSSGAAGGELAEQAEQAEQALRHCTGAGAPRVCQGQARCDRTAWCSSSRRKCQRRILGVKAHPLLEVVHHLEQALLQRDLQGRGPGGQAGRAGERAGTQHQRAGPGCRRIAMGRPGLTLTASTCSSVTSRRATATTAAAYSNSREACSMLGFVCCALQFPAPCNIKSATALAASRHGPPASIPMWLKQQALEPPGALPTLGSQPSSVFALVMSGRRREGSSAVFSTHMNWWRGAGGGVGGARDGEVGGHVCARVIAECALALHGGACCLAAALLRNAARPHVQAMWPPPACLTLPACLHTMAHRGASTTLTAGAGSGGGAHLCIGVDHLLDHLCQLNHGELACRGAESSGDSAEAAAHRAK